MTKDLTSDDFQKEVLESPVPVLVDFYTTSCPPCRRLLSVLEQVAAEVNGRFYLAKVNVWDQPELATRFRISSVPTVLIFQHGKLVNTLVGFQDTRTLLKALAQAESADMLAQG